MPKKRTHLFTLIKTRSKNTAAERVRDLTFMFLCKHNTATAKSLTGLNLRKGF